YEDPYQILTTNLKEKIAKREQEIINFYKLTTANLPYITKSSVPNGKYPLSILQEQIWISQQLSLNSGTYNIPSALRIIGPLNIELIKKSIHTIVYRHKILRTVYGEENGKLYQQILNTNEIKWQLVDFSESVDFEREKKIFNKAKEEAKNE